jgi:Xaa-Pro aminopeptidase
MPHADPGEHVIEQGDLVVFDMGALNGGYCSDCTRTFAVGEIAGSAREAYELVRRAQEQALAAVAAGVRVGDVDAAARDLIEEAGRGEQFGHPTGHGVGLEVHEAPRIGSGGEEELLEGEVVTIEPGVYEAGAFGVRIEDLVVVESGGAVVLTGLGKELQIVD